jgi:hypothetical protein
MKGHKIDEIQVKLYNLDLDFTIIEYNGSKNKSKFRHSCGFHFQVRIDHLIERKVCPSCNGRRRTIDKFQNKSDEKHNFEYNVLEFESGNKPVKILHKKCGKEFYQIGHRHLRGDRCPKCYRNFKYSRDEIVKLSFKKYDGEYELISENIEYHKKCLIRHNCGYEYTQRIYSHLLGSKCPLCAGNAPHTKDSVQKKSNEIHDDEYTIISEPRGSKSKIRILHNICGREFEQTLSDHLSGCGCTNCSMSRGEKVIESYLKEIDINFIKQKTFDGCKFKNKLKFDFYLENYNKCIEFDGPQHYKPIRFFGGKKSFELQKQKDQIKNEYCIDNRIDLLRISYECKNIEIIKLVKEFISS